MSTTYVGEALLRREAGKVEGGHIEVGGERFYRIVNYDAMPPFLMSIVSDSDHWMFVSSTGALTAGRRDPDCALFPYYTDDRIHDSQEQTGGKTIILAARAGRTALWEPFSQHYDGLYRVTRSLSKNILSNKIVFEEINHDLGISFSCAWMTSNRFGFVRRATLVNLGEDPVEIDILDGIQNILPHGVTRRFQLEYSTLADGYKENELDPETGLGLFKLSSVPGDRPEPNEALRATTVWSEGLESATRLLCSAQVDRFRSGLSVREESLIRGCRGAYFLSTRLLVVPAGGRQEWSIVAEVAQDATKVAALVGLLKSGANLCAQIDEDVERGTSNLARIVAAADGLQCTRDDLSSDRHSSNALFNTMRGGIPDSGYQVSRPDFKAFIGKANCAVAARSAAFLAALPETLPHSRLLALACEQNDADLERLAHEYLPLTFSRRHGDPSRPWNIFSIEVKNDRGERILNYQGNWRDIFQNWEALALSFPGYVESMIFKFVDSSTADGYNPYRVMRDGYDWEVLDPHDSWSYIGYWGDHQVVYLLKLLEVSARYHPGALAGLLTRRVFTYANVPYRIEPYNMLCQDPRNTIDFDAALDREIGQRVGEMGADGKALPGADGAPYRANLTEKLLVLVLARLFNFIPEGGLWMNTQRPEWNDANNALVGYGVSMVTLYYLRRFQSFCRGIFGVAGTPAIEVSAEVGVAFRRVTEALERHVKLLDGPILDQDRKSVLDALGNAGSDYRAGLYAHGFSGHQTPLCAAELVAFCDLTLRYIDHSIRANRRKDGLYHAYNLMKFDGDGIQIRRLYEMLEGQVAVLSSGALSVQESVALLDSLRNSSLYRADQNSYVLYPDRKLPGFFEKNNIAAAAIAKIKPLMEMIARGDNRIVVQDCNGVAHFNAAFRNCALLKEALPALALAEEENEAILALYEEVFDHQSFTGRSGTFYKYEGLGCIYWHMVSKLLLAVQEVLDRAGCAGEDPVAVQRLMSHYQEIREGIGVHKSPELYGAIPTDPYSHTPSFAGAQQPGMTGQVKEDLISRLGEMGVAVEDGRLCFRRHLVSLNEFLTEPRKFSFYDIDGQQCCLDLDSGSMAFTTCQVPIVTHRSGPQRVEITRADGSRSTVEALCLDAGTSSAVFERTGAVRRLDVYFCFEVH
ncbi:MAG: hypothetical protein P4K86_05505 [Terracidiphilus sp.]|nr:hypothetical protein [Terracidiphilus sp.]MDR3775652.1 hypothetical protein [Terracidiphilus sp.]